MPEYGPLTNHAEAAGWEQFNDDTNVEDGANVSFNVQPPENKAWVVYAIAMQIEPVAGASSGDHKVWIYPHPGTDDTRRFIRIEESFDNSIRPRPRGWDAAGTISDVDSISDWYGLFPFVTADGFNFRYFNGADSTATDTRNYHILRSVIVL